MTERRKIWLTAAAGAVAAGLAVGYLVRPASAVARAESYRVLAATGDQLERAAALKTFFAHQSVGRDMMEQLPSVYIAAGVRPPEVIVNELPQPDRSHGYIQHVRVGKNGDPLGKIAEFNRLVRSGIGAQVDIAALKLCYSDLRRGDDANQVFEAYSGTLSDLERDFPAVTFLAITVPLTTEQGILGRTRERLGLGDPYGPQHNVTREGFNARIRGKYAATGRLFDVAAVQSTSSAGIRRVRYMAGAEYFSMEQAVAKNPGHMNPAGSELATSAFLETIASASDAGH